MFILSRFLSNLSCGLSSASVRDTLKTVSNKKGTSLVGKMDMTALTSRELQHHVCTVKDALMFRSHAYCSYIRCQTFRKDRASVHCSFFSKYWVERNYKYLPLPQGSVMPPFFIKEQVQDNTVTNCVSYFSHYFLPSACEIAYSVK